MSSNFKVIGLTRLGIKPKSTAPEANALTTRPSELLPLDPAAHPERKVGVEIPPFETEPLFLKRSVQTVQVQ